MHLGLMQVLHDTHPLLHILPRENRWIGLNIDHTDQNELTMLDMQYIERYRR